MIDFFNKLLGENHSKELEDIVFDHYLDELADIELKSDEYILSEKDFYPPEDKRVLRTRLYDVEKDGFNKYAEDFFELCDEEEIY